MKSLTEEMGAGDTGLKVEIKPSLRTVEYGSVKERKPSPSWTPFVSRLTEVKAWCPSEDEKFEKGYELTEDRSFFNWTAVESISDSDSRNDATERNSRALMRKPSVRR